MSLLEPPSAVLLGLWGTAALQGEVPVRRAVAASRGPDDVWAPDGVELAGVLDRLRAARVTSLRVVLPAPGDPRGLPGPTGFSAVACQAGECVLAVDACPAGSTATVALVPSVQRFGSDLEPGRLVTWTEHRVEHRPALEVVSLAEADRDLRAGLLETTRQLEALDVATWRDDLAGHWADLASARLDARRLPVGLSPRAGRTLATGLRIRALVTFALEDEGGAVSGWEISRRRELLRELDGIARRAVAAAASSPGEHPPGVSTDLPSR